jgi:iron transport multicopper oxidase
MDNGRMRRVRSMTFIAKTYSRIPTIEADVGDTISVTVRNSLGNETTSLHFHGMYQKGTGVYDGATGVTACSIQPGDSYTYTFVANPAGTHWYHSHDKGQYPDGLRGKMIIHDKSWESSLNIDSQIYLSMSDWLVHHAYQHELGLTTSRYHRQMVPIIKDYMSPSNLNGDLPSPDTILFNDTRTPPVLKFSPGKNYLLRIVNIGGLACGSFHIQGYTLKVVEMDGVQTQPKNTDSIVICAGQSYGVIVTGKLNPLGGANYIVKLSTDMLTGAIPPADQITLIGKVVYNILGSILDLITDILTLNWVPAGTLDDFSVQPLDGQKLLSPVNNKIELATNQTYFIGIGTRIGIGSQPWVPPKVPSLYSALTTGNAALDPATYGPGVNPWILKSGQVVQIHYQNTHPYPHPMHLHVSYYRPGNCFACSH